MTAAVVPPVLPVAALGLVVAWLPRRAGQVAGVLGSLAVCAWLLALPPGAHLGVELLGLDAQLLLVDPFSRLLGVVLTFVAAAGVAYLRATGAGRRQTAYALAYLAAGLGAAFAGDWLTLVVFWELMAVCATVLVWHRSADRAVGFRYAIYHEIGGLALMAGVLLHVAETGTVLFGEGIAPGLPATLAALGIGLNAGVLGLHVWLVDTYPRTHVATSVVLVAVTTKVGAYAIVRAFPDGHVGLAYVGGAMVLVGVTMAILQTDMRRLLSYHVVSQVGYMLAGFGAGASLAQAGAMLHLVNNVLYKSLLFMVAGVLVLRTGRDSLKRLGGLGRPMPVAAGLYAVAALSIAGIPGFNGFISKGMVLNGVEKAGLDTLWWVLVVGGVGTVISFAKFGDAAFVRGRADDDHEDLARWELLALGSLAVACVVVGLHPGVLLDRLPPAVTAVVDPWAGKEFLKAGGVAAIGVTAYLALRDRLATATPRGDLDRVYHPLGRRLLDRSVEWSVRLEASIDAVGVTVRSSLAGLLVGDVAGRARRAAVAGGPARSIGLGLLALVVTTVLLLSLLLV